MFVSARILAGNLFHYGCVKLKHDSVGACEADMQKASDWNITRIDFSISKSLLGLS